MAAIGSHPAYIKVSSSFLLKIRSEAIKGYTVPRLKAMTFLYLEALNRILQYTQRKSWHRSLSSSCQDE